MRIGGGAAGLTAFAAVCALVVWLGAGWSGGEVPPAFAAEATAQAYRTEAGAGATSAQEPSRAWTATVETGDSFESLLEQAGLAPGLRAEVALALAVELDPAQLQPGYRLSVQSTADGRSVSVELEMSDGVRILARIADETDVRTMAPRTEPLSFAAEIRIAGSLSASLDANGLPARFAVDLAEILAGTVDFRRDIRGGETLRLLWHQRRREDGTAAGEPRLTYAGLEMGQSNLEIVWSEGEGETATLYVDGAATRGFAPPVIGARLTSSFGKRRHPIRGDVRMHTGVDFAAPRGTPVYATAAGRIAFAGRRKGYGRVVEVAHGAGTMTRYAHLSAIAAGFRAGVGVSAGERIGAIGSTGLATGPNLHYEVRLEGRPVDPLDRGLWPKLPPKQDLAMAERQLLATRERVSSLLGEVPGSAEDAIDRDLPSS